MRFNEKNNGINGKVDIAEEKISELKGIAIEFIWKEIQRIRRLGKKLTGHWWAMGQLKAL